LGHIERQSRTVLYGMAGLGAVADLPPTSTDRLRRGACFVACTLAQRPLGFALAGRLDNDALLECLAILPEFSGGGLGRALIETVSEWARQAGSHGVMVSTYRDIPWDAPFYARLGFVEIPHRFWSGAMHRLHREATALGHDPTRRLWMRLALAQ
jgi:GNAT superfamily N-acetyltransferase